MKYTLLTALVVIVSTCRIVHGQVNNDAIIEGKLFYIGITYTLERLYASYEKITEIHNPSSQQNGNIYQDNSSANGTVYGFGFILGCRIPLNKKGLYLNVEPDIIYNDGKIEGYLIGKGESEGRNQYGESWPEEWTFEKETSYALTLKLGGEPRFLRSQDASIYALAGIRRVEVQFQAHYTGCPVPEPCSNNDEFMSGTLRKSPDFIAVTSGIGLEKMIRKNIGFQTEVRYTGYKNEEWISLPDDGKVKVPAEIDNAEISLLLRLVWYL